MYLKYICFQRMIYVSNAIVDKIWYAQYEANNTNATRVPTLFLADKKHVWAFSNRYIWGIYIIVVVSFEYVYDI